MLRMVWDVEGAVANRVVAGINGSSNDDGIKWGGRRWLVRFAQRPSQGPSHDAYTITLYKRKMNTLEPTPRRKHAK